MFISFHLPGPIFYSNAVQGLQNSGQTSWNQDTSSLAFSCLHKAMRQCGKREPQWHCHPVKLLKMSFERSIWRESKKVYAQKRGDCHKFY